MRLTRVTIPSIVVVVVVDVVVDVVVGDVDVDVDVDVVDVVDDDDDTLSRDLELFSNGLIGETFFTKAEDDPDGFLELHVA